VMPHVIVKLHSGRSEQQKSKLAALITQAVMTGAYCAEQSVSVVIEDVEPAAWTEKVCEADIMGQADRHKKPGYNPL
jgi:4-oxalocrotonate tautomerase